MGERFDYRQEKIRDVPKGEPFVTLSRELLTSPAWRAMSINCRRLIDFLMIEHLNHAGSENGNLCATYDQLVAFGIPRRLIHVSMDEAEMLKLVFIERGARKSSGLSHMNRFTLTFVRQRIMAGERMGYVPPSGEWKRIKQEGVLAVKEALKQKKKR